MTSVRAAGVTSETFVAEENPTVAEALFWATTSVLPVTEVIRPATWSLPPPLGAGDVPDVVGAVALLVPDACGCCGEFDEVCDPPQAATDNAVMPIRIGSAYPRRVRGAGAV